jgi:hypothetical protein
MEQYKKKTPFYITIILVHENIYKLLYYTGCLKIREFRIQSVVGDHFSSPNMEIKKKLGISPTKIHWSEGALFELRFLQIQAEKFSVYYYLWCR